MDINKSIELLRFYLVDKIDEIQFTFQKALKNEIENLVTEVISSMTALFISFEFLSMNGVLGVFLKILILFLSYLFLKFVVISKIYRYIKTKKEKKDADEKKLSEPEIKNLIDKFDHIACDGILLSLDFLKKYNASSKKSVDEKRFYLIESFYYYKKAIDITSLIIDNCDYCINNPYKHDGIAHYRLINVYNLLDEINNGTVSILKDSYNDNSKEVSLDIENVEEKLKNIHSFLLDIVEETIIGV